jgi:ribosome maturation factor RimP
MSDLNQKVASVVTSKAKEHQLFLVDFQISGPGRPKYTILVDNAEGVTIDECTKLSRAITAELDLFPELDENGYVIEVSSPGIDKPFQFPFQYEKSIGRSLKLQLTDGKEIEGELLSASSEGFQLKIAGPKKKEFIEQSFTYPEVKVAKVIVSFK